MLYSNRGICKWVAAHLEHLNELSCHLIARFVIFVGIVNKMCIR